jgi:hypothetical protein
MSSDNTSAPARFYLRDLPFAARLTLAVFYVSVGIGYLSALINLHFQEASPGEPLPTKENVIVNYHGKSGVSQLERLLVAHPSLPFNGQGSMRSAFSEDRMKGAFNALCKTTAKKFKIKDYKKATPEQVAQVKRAVQTDLDGERMALIAWLRVPEEIKRQETYEDDRFELKGTLTLGKETIDLERMPITECMVETEENKPERYAKVKTILEDRCARCHNGTSGGAGRFPLKDFDQVNAYITPEVTGKSLSRLALTTHVHLLGFSVLYGLTGLIFAFSSYPGFLRVLIAPLPLAAQVVDISFWWLARMDAPYGPMFASAIPISGGIVAAGLGLQIVLGLFNLFGRSGKLVLVLLLVLAGVGGYEAKMKIIDPHLRQENGQHPEAPGSTRPPESQNIELNKANPADREKDQNKLE